MCYFQPFKKPCERTISFLSVKFDFASTKTLCHIKTKFRAFIMLSKSNRPVHMKSLSGNFGEVVEEILLFSYCLSGCFVVISRNVYRICFFLLRVDREKPHPTPTENAS